ncbi:MAG: hypothetical protein J2P24_03755 [Streptosporangiales bacterium]|nr:hypothetical protein [Streptosporangiales bacterium]MBO0891416.1 hypothetical protein [Acidothermales bacterium]
MSMVAVPGLVLIVVGAVLLVVVLVLLFAWPGWARGRGGTADGFPPVARPPSYPRALRPPADGTYEGTNVYRGPPVRNRGLGRRGRVRLVLAGEGLILDRRGIDDVLIEQHDLRMAEVRGQTLVIRWQHGGRPLETIVRLDRAEESDVWARSLSQMGRRP